MPPEGECTPWKILKDLVCHADLITLEGYRENYVTLAVCKALCMDFHGCVAITYYDEVSNLRFSRELKDFPNNGISERRVSLTHLIGLSAI